MTLCHAFIVRVVEECQQPKPASPGHTLRGAADAAFRAFIVRVIEEYHHPKTS